MLLVVLGCLVIPALASAHAALIRSAPASDQIVKTSPTTVTLTFNEPVETALGAVRVFDGNAARVDVGTTTRAGANAVATRIDTSLARGTYTVSWRVASADGHPLEGAFVFHVGAPGERPEGIASQVAQRPSSGVGKAVDVARFLNVLLVIALIGAIAVNLILFARHDPEVERRLWYVIAGLGFGLSIVAAATVVLFAASIAGAGLGKATNGTALSAILGTRFGHVRLAQLIVAEVIAIAAVWAPSPGGAKWLKRGIGVLALALAVTPGLSGHAGAKGTLEVIADTGHVLAASVWAGGLATVMLGLGLAGERRRELARNVFPRFSRLVLWAVGVLLVSGTIGGLSGVDHLNELWNTTYGKLLLAKISIALVLIGFGVFNRRAVRGLSNAKAAPGFLSWLQRSVAAEFVLMAAAIGVTSFLISKPQANAIVAKLPRAATATGQIGDLGARLVLDPGTKGQNLVHVYLSRGGAPQTADEVTVTARSQVGDVGPFRLIMSQADRGHYLSPPLQVSLGGLWTFDVAVRRGDFDLNDVVLTVPLRTSAP